MIGDYVKYICNAHTVHFLEFYIIYGHISIPGSVFMPFENHDFLYFFMPKFSKDFGAKNQENHEF